MRRTVRVLCVLHGPSSSAGRGAPARTGPIRTGEGQYHVNEACSGLPHGRKQPTRVPATRLQPRRTLVQHLLEFKSVLSRLQRGQLVLSESDRVALASLVSDLRRIVQLNSPTADQ
jgi:hypothetical protein